MPPAAREVAFGAAPAAFQTVGVEDAPLIIHGGNTTVVAGEALLARRQKCVPIPPAEIRFSFGSHAS